MNSSSSTNAISADHTLTTFLCHAVAANRAEQKTLTLVTPKSIALEPAFFCDLAEVWRSLQSKLSISEETRLQIDICQGESAGGWFRSLLERVDLFRCRREFAKRQIEPWISLTRCLVIGRPTTDPPVVVMGIASEEVSLPSWTKAATMRLPNN
ncbi:hypothetical protein [Neorhodopirellula lusitana]